MFSKILIANRDEIAVRIIRACKDMGIATVAVYSSADAGSIHTALADECICVGPPAASESYLNQQNIISAALLTGAQAIHPGYGFLSENAEFAALCKKHGIVFIGPSGDIISKMGDKDAARRMMREAGVPVVPGCDLVPDVETAKLEGEKIGYPLLIKARAGGGGKGIRLVESAEDVEHAYLAASEEAQRAFGDGSVYMEKFLKPVKHIEMQMLADEKGNVVCLGERECSIQKNNQKLLEESPSSAMTLELRGKMTEAAMRAVKVANYVSVGTVEFLLDRDGNYYFMEMNTRLQVEHPVTEQVADIDLVQWQIRVAAGVPLDFTQEDIQLNGAAIECRINAKGSGKVPFLHIPGGPNVRFDTGLYQGCTVPHHYDSLIGKLIVRAKTREDAIRKMQSALCELVIDGVPNNIEEQIEIVSDATFKKGDYYTDFMTKRGEH